ncbi:MBL fold metallo-hydrolase [Pedobacter yulinensis]|uniref:MBL fold metallo-hydrolase n=1 Tax=Pedobacter yulinensis TaxID=2126353 RepID=A0A2T3HID0_9SPHI|nr:MBL fold metallo-hydrolase [Pedobacter yulinensis]PST82198.1 MBL fold metallo-hydrolase [Pedobacter yulinensis]
MSLFVTSLNSGSNGNCYYVGNDREAVLVDAGISCREIEKRMARLGLDVNKVAAVFISHEHSDHIRGLSVLARKYRLPVYVTEKTRQQLRLLLDEQRTYCFCSGDSIQIGDLTVKCFLKRHDAIDPHSFVVEGAGVRVGVFTDLGACCEELSAHFGRCHAAFLESNYCEDMLERGRYPYFLKNRIKGGYGHLSNRQALDVFLSYRSEYLNLLLLAHLSRDNNDPQLVADLFGAHAGQTRVVVASRYEETPVFRVHTTHLVPASPVQATLF